jgi:hypothetical protein
VAVGASGVLDGVGRCKVHTCTRLRAQLDRRRSRPATKRDASGRIEIIGSGLGSIKVLSDEELHQEVRGGVVGGGSWL